MTKGEATPERLTAFSDSVFAVIFLILVLEFSATWIANTELAPVPVAIYAGVFTPSPWHPGTPDRSLL